MTVRREKSNMERFLQGQVVQRNGMQDFSPQSKAESMEIHSRLHLHHLARTFPQVFNNLCQKWPHSSLTFFGNPCLVFIALNVQGTCWILKSYGEEMWESLSLCGATEGGGWPHCSSCFKLSCCSSCCQEGLQCQCLLQVWLGKDLFGIGSLHLPMIGKQHLRDLAQVFSLWFGIVPSFSIIGTLWVSWTCFAVSVWVYLLMQIVWICLWLCTTNACVWRFLWGYEPWAGALL